MKWLYIKNGDAVTQLKRLSKAGGDRPEAGPDAFLADFLYGIKGEPALLLSWCTQDDEFVTGDQRARTYKASGSPLRRLGNVTLRLKATISSMQELLRFKPQRIICGRVGPMLWVTAIFSKFFGIPFIHSRHNSLYERQAKWYQRLLAHFDLVAIRQSRAVICHGPFLAHQIGEIGVAPERILEFDIGFEHFNISNDQSFESVDAFATKKILYVGRVDRNKGVIDLFHAMSEMLSEKIVLQYVGEGPAIKDIQELAYNLGVHKYVTCTGSVEHSELPGIINSSYLMITPTRREFPEGRCMAAMEALACSVPVIAPDSGPFPFLVKNKVNGLLFTPDNVESLSQAIRRALSEDELYLLLKRGASMSAVELMTPVRTFYQAVEQGFDV